MSGGIMSGMAGQDEKSSKRVLAVGVLFATVGLIALGIALMQPAPKDDRALEPEQVFTTLSPEEKEQLHAQVTAEVGEPAPDLTEDDKRRLLETMSQ